MRRSVCAVCLNCQRALHAAWMGTWWSFGTWLSSRAWCMRRRAGLPQGPFLDDVDTSRFRLWAGRYWQRHDFRSLSAHELLDSLKVLLSTVWMLPAFGCGLSDIDNGVVPEVLKLTNFSLPQGASLHDVDAFRFQLWCDIGNGMVPEGLRFTNFGSSQCALLKDVDVPSRFQDLGAQF